MNRSLVAVLLSVALLATSSSLCSCMQSATCQRTERGNIRVLIVDGFSNHDWKQTTVLVRQILEASGLFSVDVSSAPSADGPSDGETWRPPFDAYDVVIQNCNSIGDRGAWPEQVQQDLERYVSQGGGVYILHSGNNAFPQWEEYNKMIGLGWRNKNFGWAITVDDDGRLRRIPPGEGANTGHGKRIDALLTRLGEHPIHRGLPQSWRAADLEVYRYARGPAENLTVLSYAREPETGLNFPIEWVVRYGEGRIYNSTFGHVWTGASNPPAMRCVAFQTLLIRAMEWVGGREVTWPVPDNFPTDKNIQLSGENS